MCGIAGIFSPGSRAEQVQSAALSMADSIASRGPDSHGVWKDKELPLAFAHRRLAILDLSEQGHQPMHSRSRRFVTVYNGEIYNFEEIRKELEKSGAVFRGGSDTEVMLEAVERWGMLGALKRFNGMFALAVWDRQERVLWLVRDRMGIKPLYYGWVGGAFLFGSELKAIAAAARSELEVRKGAASLLLGFNYIPAPWSIYNGIYKLMPGTVLNLSETDLVSKPGTFSPWATGTGVVETLTSGQPQHFWSIHDAVRRGRERAKGRDCQEAMEELKDVLVQSVKRRMIADVPLGAFLSGGVDSSLVVALMQSQSSKPVKTFSIGFHEQLYNEAHHAKRVADHLGTDHTELYLSAEEAMAIIPDLPGYYDEPFSDASQIPTYLVSRLAREHVTVSLSGDGGDELFCGYTRYFLLERLWQGLQRIPGWARNPAAGLLHMIPNQMWGAVFAAFNPVLPKRYRLHNAAAKAHRLAEFLEATGSNQQGLGAFYRCGNAHWINADALLSPDDVLQTFFEHPHSQVADLNEQEFMMFADMNTYLPDDILVKVDRASMAVSLEARVPLLDHTVVETAWSLPHEMRVSEGESKWALKEILKKHVPADLLDRPKMGFGIPHGEWLKGPLREWAEELLSEKRLREGGFLEAEPVRRAWTEHLSGKRDWQYRLWDVLMLQAWMESSAA